jgi:hypothetical protein
MVACSKEIAPNPNPRDSASGVLLMWTRLLFGLELERLVWGELRPVNDAAFEGAQVDLRYRDMLVPKRFLGVLGPDVCCSRKAGSVFRCAVISSSK